MSLREYLPQSKYLDLDVSLSTRVTVVTMNIILIRVNGRLWIKELLGTGAYGMLC